MYFNPNTNIYAKPYFMKDITGLQHDSTALTWVITYHMDSFIT